MSSFSRRIVQLFIGLAVFAACAIPMFAQAKPQGEYLFVSDSDGGNAGSGARVTINFAASTAVVNAVKPNDQFTDQGPYTLQGNRITIKLPLLGISVSGKPFVLAGATLVLPFKVFSEGNGTSTWKKSFAASFGANPGKPGDSGTPGGQGTPGGKGSDGSKGDQGDKGTTGDPGQNGQNGQNGQVGQNGRDGKNGQSVKIEKDGKKAGPFADMMGGWIGKGASSETRFRGPGGILILIVKHTNEFFFYVDEKGQLEGEGSIEYDMDRNTQGLDNIVANVRSMMSMLPAASTPGSGGAASSANSMGAAAQGSATQLQYDATHLKNGKEIRHYKFKGHIDQITLLDGQGQERRLYLELVGGYTMPDGKADNNLIAAWEVNNKKEEKAFPCWSPFLKNAGILRRGPGGIWMAEFSEKGTHRNGVKPWLEYGYVWMARQNK